MPDELAILPNSAADPRGHRYTEADKATAYLLWRTVCGRSARKVGERLGISDESIRRWIDSDNWTARANSDDQDDYASSRHGVAAVVVTELVKSLETVTAIRDDPTASNKDRLTAAFWLAGLAGVSPVSKIEQAVTEQRTQPVDIIPDFSSMSPEELRAYDESIRKQVKRKTTTVPQPSHHQ